MRITINGLKIHIMMKKPKELLAIKDNEKEIEDRFYKELEFGTGGMRGIIKQAPTG